MRLLLTLMLCLSLCTSPKLSLLLQADTEPAAPLSLTAPSYLLMEASTGTVICEKDSHTRMRPASITKIMTLILIFDALEKGSIQLTDTVTVSEYAASMGGSQVFLEPGEIQTVETMIKCISVASANDACVAMAEHISGSETAFVEQMNARAKALHMDDTTFVNCCGLDVDGHMTSAHDVALMSRELITRYPQIHDYCTIWMENIIHETARGSSEFGLTNTNKLIRQYPYATGLKTGFTNQAMYCISATAKKDGVELIAVIMGAPNFKTRQKDATALLNYGFSKCSFYIDKKMQALPEVPVRKGKEKTVPLTYQKQFQYLSTDGQNISDVKRKLRIHREVDAPIKKGSKAGEMIYSAGDRELGRVDILYDKTVPKATYMDALKTVLENL